jgi:hypothetical protein
MDLMKLDKNSDETEIDLDNLEVAVLLHLEFLVERRLLQQQE